MTKYVNVIEYRDAAKRRLPNFAFDYLDGGSEDGSTLERNSDILDKILFNTSVLQDISTYDPSVTLFNRSQKQPFMVGPTGLNGLFWPNADIILAKQAETTGIPFILSTASTSTIEAVRKASQGDLWLQLYIQQDKRIAEDLIRRAKHAGFSTLMLTVDTPVHGKRDHDRRNGFELPLKIKTRLVLDLLLNPHWTWQMATNGGPKLANLAQSIQGNAGSSTQKLAASLSRQMNLSLNWDDLLWLRENWPGEIIVKGILSTEDVQRASQSGIDGVVLSNHGGRQLPSVPSALEILPQAIEKAGDMAVLVDGGFRRGSDIVKAIALGADAILLGRAPLYGLAASGSHGVADVLSILSEEMEITMKLIGKPSYSLLRRNALYIAATSVNSQNILQTR